LKFSLLDCKELAYQTLNSKQVNYIPIQANVMYKATVIFYSRIAFNSSIDFYEFPYALAANINNIFINIPSSITLFFKAKPRIVAVIWTNTRTPSM